MKKLGQKGVLLSVLMLSACGSNPSSWTSYTAKQDELAKFKEYHFASSKKLKNNGQLHQALLHWRIIASLDPYDLQAKKEIDHLEQQIDKKTSVLIQQVRKNLKAKKLTSARKSLLRVLSLNPEHTEALAMLRQFTGATKLSKGIKHRKVVTLPAVSKKRALNKDRKVTQKSKPTPKKISASSRLVAPKQKKNDDIRIDQFQRLYEKRQYQALLNKAEKIETDQALPQLLLGWLSEANIVLAQSLRKQGRLHAARSHIKRALQYPDPNGRVLVLFHRVNDELARKLFASGRELLYSDIDQAIALWEEALKYDEEFSEVKYELEKAYRIQKNLVSIKKAN